MRSPEPTPNGDLRRRFWRLTFYNILSNLTVPLTGLVDTAMLGHLPDIRFLAGVALGSILFDYLYWGLGFLRMGTTGTVAQAAGRGDLAEARGILLRTLLLASALGFTILLLMVPIREAGFALLAGEEAVKAAGRDYFTMRILGAPAVLCNFVILGWLLGRERSGLALAITAAGNCANVVFDYLFIFHLGLNAQGAGLATALSQYCMLVPGLVLVWRLREGNEVTRAQVLAPQRLLGLVRLNLDIMIRTMCLLTAFMLFLNFSARIGTATLVANTLLHHLITFAAFLIDGPALAAEILMGGFKGSKDGASQRRTVRLAFLSGQAITLSYLAVFFTAPAFFLSLLTDHDHIVALAGGYYLWMIPYLLFASGAYVLDGLFLGLTRVRELRNAMLVSVIVGFLPLALLATREADNQILWAAMTMFACARLLTLTYLFRRRGPSDPGS